MSIRRKVYKKFAISIKMVNRCVFGSSNNIQKYMQYREGDEIGICNYDCPFRERSLFSVMLMNRVVWHRKACNSYVVGSCLDHNIKDPSERRIRLKWLGMVYFYNRGAFHILYSTI